MDVFSPKRIEVGITGQEVTDSFPAFLLVVVHLGGVYSV